MTRLAKQCGAGGLKMDTKTRWFMAALVFILVFSAAAIPTQTVYAASFTVNDTRDRVDSNPGNGVCRTGAGTCTLRAAIQEANARSGADLITLPPGTYMITRAPLNENSISTGDFDITAPVTIIGAGAGPTIIDGGTPPPGSPSDRTALDRLFEIHSTAGNVTLSGMTIREGWEQKEGGAIYTRSRGTVRLTDVKVLNSFANTSGGGIYYDGFEGGSLIIERSTISGNTTNGEGGGIYVASGDLTVSGMALVNSAISGNTAREGGGLYNTGKLTQAGHPSQVELTFTTISGNNATDSGGGIANELEGLLSLTDVTVSGNSASSDGGGVISVFKTTLAVIRGTFSSNTAGASGGGVFTHTEGPVTIEASKFSGNMSREPFVPLLGGGGGGLYVDGRGTVSINGSSFTANSAAGEGGGIAIHSSGDVVITDTQVNDNTSQHNGGGVLNSGFVVTFTDMLFTGNTAMANGGGIDNQSSSDFFINNTSFLSNTTGINGGGLHNIADGPLSISNSRFLSNSAEHGGGLHDEADKPLSIVGTTFWDNQALGVGGGLLHQGDAETELLNSTISSNRAGLNGGGLYLDSDGGLHVINTTITLNSAPYGSGVGTADAIDNFPIVAHPLLIFRNTIVAGNEGGLDCHAAFGSEGGNLDGGTLCNFQGPRDRGNVANLGLSPLADNGGPTLTHALLPGSPAVGGGVDSVMDASGSIVPACPATDQRGVSREPDRPCDIGAYEFEGTPAGPPSDMTPPETTLSAGPSDTTEATDATFAFSSNDPDATFACSLDAAPYVSCSSPLMYTELSAGTHTFEVRAIDAAGNTDPTPASFGWSIELPPDSTPPETSIDSGPSSTTESRDAIFIFSSEPAATFECSLDGVSYAGCASPIEYLGLTAGSHTFGVRATDSTGNQDPTPASYSWTIIPPPDVTPPQSTIVSGPSLITTDTAASFIFSANESGSTFKCALDGGAAPSFNNCNSPIQYTGLSVGNHTFAVQATDPAGNLELVPVSYTWAIISLPDFTPPETTLASGPTSPTESTSALFTFSASESGSTFECALDGEAFEACISPIEYTGLGVTDHAFGVRAIDPSGNIDPTPEVYLWTIELAIETMIDSGPPATTESRDATFIFSASKPSGATFECGLDGAAFASCVSPVEYRGLRLGSHTFAVRAIDSVGNVDPTPESYTWTIEPMSACGAPVILFADADAWIDENSSSTNKGSDSILKIQSKSPHDNFRTLVHFALSVDLPAGCVVKSATLSLYTASGTPERTLEVLQVADAWSENQVTWANQPQTTGTAATTDSASGNLEWDVTSQVQAMYDAGANYGFLIRDSVEGESGAEQQFHSREKGENPPQLVITFVHSP
jgi:CSLREA domain-containing protein